MTNEKMFPPKMLESPNGTWEHYFPVSNTKPFHGGKMEIIKKWTDSDRSVYYYTLDTETFGVDKGKVRRLWKISEDGKVLEMVWRESAGTTFDPNGMPADIDPKDRVYSIFARAVD